LGRRLVWRVKIMPGSEDQRSAANIYTSLSSYVITASLAVYGGDGNLAGSRLAARRRDAFPLPPSR
jgi:hypothetical protein